MNVDKLPVYQSVYQIEKWLESVQRLDELIATKIAERDQLLDMATSITAKVNDMPHGSGASDKIGNSAARLVDLASDTDKLIDQYIDRKADVAKALEHLPNAEYLVMHKRYIQGMTWRQVAEEVGYTEQHVWRLKVKALQRLQHVMKCCGM